MKKDRIEFRFNHFMDATFNNEEAALDKIKEKTPGVEDWTVKGIYHESNPFSPIGYSGEVFRLYVEFAPASHSRVKIIDAFIAKKTTKAKPQSTQSIRVPIVRYTMGKYSIYNTHMEIRKPVLEAHSYQDKGMKTRSFTVVFEDCPPRVYSLQSRVLAGNDKRDEVAMMAAHDLIRDRLFIYKTKDLLLHKYLEAVEEEFGPFDGTKELILRVEELDGFKNSYIPYELYEEEGAFRLDFDEVSEDGSSEAYSSLYKIETLS